MFSRQLLDDESSQDKDGVRRVVKALKRIGEFVGLRWQDKNSIGDTKLARGKPPYGSKNICLLEKH